MSSMKCLSESGTPAAESHAGENDGDLICDKESGGVFNYNAKTSVLSKTELPGKYVLSIIHGIYIYLYIRTYIMIYNI